MVNEPAAQPHACDDEYQHLHVLTLNEHPHVTLVLLDRPKQRHAVNAALWKELGRVFGTLGTEGDGTRCIILSSTPTPPPKQVFCAGIDLRDASMALPTATPDETKNVVHTGLAFVYKIREMQAAFTAVEACPVPVIATVNGACIGAGLDLILCADVRLCDASAKFAVKEVALGLTADVGTLQRLPKTTGNSSWVADVCLTGRNFGAAEALQFGLVSRVVTKTNVLHEAVELACSMAKHCPIAVRGTKQAMLYARDHSVADGLEQVAAYNALALQSPHLGLTATRARTGPPTYPDFPAHSRL